MPHRREHIELLEPEHRYIHVPTSREIPGVTHTMRAHGIGFQGVAPQEALQRGSWVHAASVLIDEDDLDERSVPREWAGYLDAYRRAVRETGVRMLEAEWRFWVPEYGYAGTLDRIALRKARRGQIELKTGDTSDVDVQVAAYDRGWRRWNPERPCEWAECWKLNDDGTYRIVPIDIEAGWRIFAACLVVEERKRANGSKRSERIAA